MVDYLIFFIHGIRIFAYNHMSDNAKKKYLVSWYKKKTGKTLNWNNIQTFNEKMQWLKIYDNAPIKADLSDKYLVRAWIKKQIGEEYLIPLIGAYENANDIDFDALPSSFVLKANQGSGMNIIVRDKNNLNINKTRKALRRWLHHPSGINGMEQQYCSIKRQILVEKFISQMDGNLMDYKIHCFNGQPRLIQVIGDRDITKHTAKEMVYDINWNKNFLMYHTYDEYDYDLPKPQELPQMLEIASKLSKGFRYVRVDLYIIDGNIKFGEMTFTPASGKENWSDHEAELLVGSWININ